MTLNSGPKLPGGKPPDGPPEKGGGGLYAFFFEGQVPDTLKEIGKYIRAVLMAAVFAVLVHVMHEWRIAPAINQMNQTAAQLSAHLADDKKGSVVCEISLPWDTSQTLLELAHNARSISTTLQVFHDHVGHRKWLASQHSDQPPQAPAHEPARQEIASAAEPEAEETGEYEEEEREAQVERKKLRKQAPQPEAELEPSKERPEPPLAAPPAAASPEPPAVRTPVLAAPVPPQESYEQRMERKRREYRERLQPGG